MVKILILGFCSSLAVGMATGLPGSSRVTLVCVHFGIHEFDFD